MNKINNIFSGNPFQDLFNRGSSKAYLALSATSTIWGTTWVASKIAVLHAPGLQVSSIRQLLAGTIFIVFFKLKGEPWPTLHQLKSLLVISLFLIIINNGFATWSLRYIPSGLGALIGALYPLCVVLIEMIFFKTKNTIFTFIGLLIGFAGISVVFYDNAFSNHEKGYAFGLVLGMVAMICWSIGTILVAKNKMQINSYYGLGWQMFMASPFIFLMSAATGNHIPLQDIPLTSWAAIFYLVLFGSIIAFICFLYSMKHLPTAISSLYAYINPIVAMLVGSVLLSEKLTFNILTGTIITLAGVYLVNYSMKEKISTEPVEHGT